jgi:hypothetical protein
LPQSNVPLPQSNVPLPQVSFHGVEGNFLCHEATFLRHEATLVCANGVSFEADAIPFVMKEVLLLEIHNIAHRCELIENHDNSR